MRIRVPATIANLGSGFDTAGIAVDLWSEAVVESGGDSIELSFEGKGAEKYSNVAEEFMLKLIELWGWEGGLRIHFLNRIPVAKGLGSSAALLTAVARALSSLSGERSLEKMINVVTEIEGHPDNCSASALGGFVVSARAKSGVVWARADVPPHLQILLCMPEEDTLTDKARMSLPEKVPLAHTVFNLQRVSLLTASFFSGRLELLREATRDRIHQSHRVPPTALELIEELLDAGALGAFVAGSGPSIAVFCDRSDATLLDNLRSQLQDYAPVLQLSPTNRGVEEIE